MKFPDLSDEEYRKLKAIYDAAPAKKEEIEKLLAAGNPFRRLDIKKESPVIEEHFKDTIFESGTITEGIVLRIGDETIVRCEIILNEDYYAELLTDETFSFVKINGAHKKSPW